MDNIHYDPERILNGFTEDVLKELAKKLKRRLRSIKSDIIQEILSPPKGKQEDRVKVWQEINRQLRRELETFSEEKLKTFSFGDVPPDDQFKVGYMFTLSPNSEIREMGKELYCQAEENKEKEEAVALIAAITAKLEGWKAEASIEARVAEEPIEARAAEETIEAREAEELIEAREAEELIEAREAEDSIEARGAKEITVKTIGAFGLKMPPQELGIEKTEELQKRIRTLETKLRNANSAGLRTKEQLEKLRIDMVAIKSQWIREREETGKYRNRVREIEAELTEKEKEIDLLKQKLDQRKTLAPQNIKQNSQHRDLKKVKDALCGEIDLASYQGRKALIFAERDNEVDIRLNALGVIPIWAMEIDWNRPRRRMSTCEIVLYKMNNEKLQKLDEIRDIARLWNIPCNELLNI
jgi:hypothetical protein